MVNWLALYLRHRRPAQKTEKVSPLSPIQQRARKVSIHTPLSCSREFNIPVPDLVSRRFGRPDISELHLEREKGFNIEFSHSLRYNLYFLLFRSRL
ncbi:hypothetical protein CEXT_537071 [Caerostris extrusa]|uniref:Uncharacterized protein n=1 Tax=Caerostris extrusa TaxID=172846 RepID=A0AAV4N0H5_CAEEX|nr:hypothetical protein CEXT_537071 [Caerostris extrusa]